MSVKRIALCLVILCYLVNSTLGGPHARRLLKHLFVKQEHNPLERPVQNDSEALPVEIKFSLMQIIDCDVQKKILTAYMWVTQSWHDYSMTWSPEEYGNITEIQVPSAKIWLPDILLYNSVNENYDNQMKTNVVISHTGTVLHVSPRIFKSICSFTTDQSLPFQTQICSMKFGSWTTSKSTIDLTIPINKMDVNAYIVNNEWMLTDFSASNNDEQYECCPEIYQHVLLVIELRRRHVNDYSINTNDTANENI